MNDTCYFTFDLKKLDPPARPPTHPPTTTTHPPLPHYSPTTTTTQHQQQHQPLNLTRKTTLDFTTTDLHIEISCPVRCHHVFSWWNYFLRVRLASAASIIYQTKHLPFSDGFSELLQQKQGSFGKWTLGLRLTHAVQTSSVLMPIASMKLERSPEEIAS